MRWALYTAVLRIKRYGVFDVVRSIKGHGVVDALGAFHRGTEYQGVSSVRCGGAHKMFAHDWEFTLTIRKKETNALHLGLGPLRSKLYQTTPQYSYE